MEAAKKSGQIIKRPTVTQQPRQKQFFSVRSHAPIWRMLRAAIVQGEGVVVITGETGSGKSHLLQRLQDILPENRDIVKIPEPSQNAADFLGTIRDAVRLQSFNALLPEAFETEEEEPIGEVLENRAQRGRKLLVAIDQAHRLTREHADLLNLVVRFSSNGVKPVQVLLAGLPELTDSLDTGDLASLRPVIIGMGVISNLSRNEVWEYIHFQVEKTLGAYYRVSWFAWVEVFSLSQGNPGKIDLILQKVLSHLKVRSERIISRALIRRIMDGRNTPPGAAPKMDRTPLIAASVLLVLVSLGAYKMFSGGWPWPHKTKQTQSVVSYEKPADATDVPQNDTKLKAAENNIPPSGHPTWPSKSSVTSKGEPLLGLKGVAEPTDRADSEPADERSEVAGGPRSVPSTTAKSRLKNSNEKSSTYVALRRDAPRSKANETKLAEGEPVSKGGAEDLPTYGRSTQPEKSTTNKYWPLQEAKTDAELTTRPEKKSVDQSVDQEDEVANSASDESAPAITTKPHLKQHPLQFPHPRRATSKTDNTPPPETRSKKAYEEGSPRHGASARLAVNSVPTPEPLLAPSAHAQSLRPAPASSRETNTRPRSKRHGRSTGYGLEGDRLEQQAKLILNDLRDRNADSSDVASEETLRAAGRLFVVQTGSFINRENAEKLSDELRKKGLDPYVHLFEKDRRRWFSVRINYRSLRRAERMAVVVKKNVGLPTQVIDLFYE